MSYIQFNDELYKNIAYRRYPFPYAYFYPYYSSVPNLCCHDYNVNLVDNLEYYDRDPCTMIYDYDCYYRCAYQDPSCCMNFTSNLLVTNDVGYSVPIPFTTPTKIDINLVDPWQMIIINDVIWVTNCGSGLITTYDLLGRRLLPIVNVFGPLNNIAQPTGMVINTCDGYPIINGPIDGPSRLIIVTRDGTINGYNESVYSDNSVILIDNSKEKCVYTGIEIVNGIIFVADFYNQKIDVYDGALKKLDKCKFIDNSEDPIPEDFAPYNIVNINDFLYVTYAKQNPLDNQYEIGGAGLGYINIFSLNGQFVRRFASRGVLNAPWNIMIAPSWMGYPSGALMVGNFGDGIINIFYPSGEYLDQLKDGCGNIISPGNLRCFIESPNCSKILYWAAITNNLKTSLLGTINSFCKSI